MEKSASIINLAKSLLEFQKKVGKIKKDSVNNFLNKKYASLSNILDQITTPLQECGLAITQFPTGEAGLTSILIHAETGEYMQDTCDIKNLKEDAQVRGSHISYLRRYALCAILSLNIDDEGGNEAQGQQQQPKVKQKNDQLPWLNPGPVFKEVVNELCSGNTTIDTVKEKFKVSKATEEALRTALHEVIKSKVKEAKDLNVLTSTYALFKNDVDNSEDLKATFSNRKKELTPAK
jgi:hypothetical protein